MMVGKTLDIFQSHLSLDFVEERFQLVHVRFLRRPSYAQTLRLIRFRDLLEI